MSDFGNEFASEFDAELMEILGDTITIVHPDHGTVVIQAEFDDTVDEKGLADHISDYYPHMDVLHEHYYLFADKQAVISYNGSDYTIYSDKPIDKLMHRIVLQDG